MFKVERDKILDSYGRVLWLLRKAPSHAAHWLSGVYLPPHERLWLGLFFSHYKENSIVASRGTSKSFVIASFSAPLYDTLHKNNTSLIVSASGFRGGKLLFEDIDRLFKGELRSQLPEGDFLQANVESSTKKKVVSRQPDMWSVKHKSHGLTMTVPTNNADSMRGIRANIAVVDERNTFDGEVVQKVIRPMLNVGSDFRKTATSSDRNKIFQVSTIDYTFRDWYPEIQQLNHLARREYDAQMARKGGDWKKYEELMSQDGDALRGASFSTSRLDYTDIIIPQKFTSMDKKYEYEVKLPLDDATEEEDVLVWDERDKRKYWYLYPVNKKQLEDPYLDGTMDEDLWMAEQRNVFISASGNVYPHQLIVKAADQPVYPSGKSPNHPEYNEDFHAPILYTCGDPCVMGVDYARESDEFAVVVIRLGPLAESKFDPTLTSLDSEGRFTVGETNWSHVVWAESHKRITASQAAEKIRNLRDRYNIINVPLIGGGIGMDKKGGGSAVRDELAIPKPPMINGVPDPSWEAPVKIYDPDDEDYAHYSNMDGQEKYWSGLHLINPTNQSNLESTMASKAMLQKKQLYIGYYESPSRWANRYGMVNSLGGIDDSNPMYYSLLAGYNGVSRLKSQLIRLQNKVSESGVIRYIMPGKRELEEGKKDLYSAFIYATFMARMHLVGVTKDGMGAPPTARPIALQIGGDRKAKGKGRSWTSLHWGGK